MIKSFEEFVNENYLDSPADAEIVDFDFKKMKKNGYTEVTVEKGIEELEKGEKVLVDATEFGQLSDDAIVTCFTKDGEKVAIQKQNLKVEESEDKSDSDEDDESEDEKEVFR